MGIDEEKCCQRIREVLLANIRKSPPANLTDPQVFLGIVLFKLKDSTFVRKLFADVKIQAILERISRARKQHGKPMRKRNILQSLVDCLIAYFDKGLSDEIANAWVSNLINDLLKEQYDKVLAEVGYKPVVDRPLAVIPPDLILALTSLGLPILNVHAHPDSAAMTAGSK